MEEGFAVSSLQEDVGLGEFGEDDVLAAPDQCGGFGGADGVREELVGGGGDGTAGASIRCR